MSTLRLLVIAADGSWSGIVPRELAIQSIAALSADPSTLEELQAALGRFVSLPPGNLPLADLLPGEWDTPHDAGIVILELVGQLVVARAKGVTLTHKGDVFWQIGEELPFLESTDVCLPYELSADWLLCEHLDGWRELAAERRELSASKQLDFRAVLYGAPLFDYIATRVWDEAQEAGDNGLLERLWEARSGAARSGAAAGMRRSAPDMTGYLPEEDDPPLERFDFRGSNAEWEIIRRLHVDWLLTPRGDLWNTSPREVAMREHERIAADLDDQAQRWTLLELEPPGVPLHSNAARFGCFGSHEWIEYYDLVRELLWDCWFRLVADCSESTRPGSLVRGGLGAGPGTGRGTPEERNAFRESEAARLADRAEAWLDTPCFDFPKRTPRSIIERERARLPEVEREHHALPEPDCPICEMPGSSNNPVFWGLDGCNMDDDFAFDLYCETEEEWREKQVDWQRFMREVAQRQ